MNTDIRLSTSFRNHRKIKKLKRILGADGVLALVNLWIGAAVSKPHGVLSGWDKDDVCLEAEWNGDPNELVDTLIQLRLLDIDDGGNYCLHNWNRHQSWVVGAEKRSEKARKAAEVRWKQDECSGHATSIASGMQDASGKNADSNAPLPTSPSLTPDTYQEGNKYKRAEDGQSWVNIQTGEFTDELTPFDEEVENV